MKDKHFLRAPGFISSDTTKYIAAPAAYFYFLESSNSRRAFALARSSTLPSAVLEGKFKAVHYSLRLCSYPLREIDSMEHIFFNCPSHSKIRAETISPLVERFPGSSNKIKLDYLLSDRNHQTTCQVARFCAQVYKQRKSHKAD